MNILGSFTPDEPLELTDLSYRAVDWGQEEIGVEIADYRYLVLNQNDYTVNNESAIDIPFYSSHETVIKSITMTYYLYNTTAAGLEKAVTISQAQNRQSGLENNGDSIFNYSIDNTINTATSSRTLSVNHPLIQWNPYSTYGGARLYLGPETVGGAYPTEQTINNRIANIWYYLPVDPEAAAYSRYKIDVQIVHKDKLNAPDESNFTQKITIIQYPALNIEATTNTYPLNSDGNLAVATTALTAVVGNLYINDNQAAGSTDDAVQWIRARGLQGSNTNPNMYVINVTMLNDNSYFIGDPRVTTPNNLTTGFTGSAPANGWADAPAIEYGDTDNTTQKRKLQNYYPTDAADNMKYRIAPEIRVASSYGVCGKPISYTDAQRRCASYQEDKYPAGRWRIPTVGELEYIIKLSLEGKIPQLFNVTDAGSKYWTAQGMVITKLTDGKLPDPETGNNVTGYVRCVYDEWYWGSSVITTTETQTVGGEVFKKYPFVWGDAARPTNN